MKHIFLSPHFDDVALSCGDYVKALTKQGEDVEIWTLFSASRYENLSPLALQLHNIYDGRAKDKLVEHRNCCEFLGAKAYNFMMYDAIYRGYTEGKLYETLEDLFNTTIDEEKDTLNTVSKMFYEKYQMLDDNTMFYSPSGIGNHIDHLLTLEVAKRYVNCDDLIFYEDVPYIFKQDKTRHKLDEDNINYLTKLEAVRFYKTQISVLWDNETQMKDDLRRNTRFWRDGNEM